MSHLFSGIIALWSGAIVDIPVDWALCDGNNGTPDLRDRFVVGAGTTYDPDDTGGSTQHSHSGVTTGHIHSIAPGGAIGPGATWDAATNPATDSFITSTINHLPPYYALAYIMFL